MRICICTCICMYVHEAERQGWEKLSSGHGWSRLLLSSSGHCMHANARHSKSPALTIELLTALT